MRQHPDVPGAATGPTRFEPPISPMAAAFWDATRERRLVLQWCNACRRPVWYPREVCPRCLGSTLEWRESQGRGVVYACTVEHKAQTRALEAPYVVALVDLDEGVRLLSNVVGCPPERVGVGDRVHVTWEPLSDGRNLPLFAPVGARSNKMFWSEHAQRFAELVMNIRGADSMVLPDAPGGQR